MYRAPVRDLAFALEVAGFDALSRITHPEFDRDTLEAILEEAGRFATEVLAPLNRAGDKAGAKFENGQVRAAPGFAPALRAYGEGGWTGLSAPIEHGGQGLPRAVSLAVFEMVHAANMAFGLCPMLTEAAIEAVASHGTDRQKALYLPPLIAGAWTGCMDLTEPQAGSDLALVRTTAEPDGKGGYLLNGQKIYITWGDHDATENILHLVLARLPDAPSGVKGISLFVSPKRCLDEAGRPGVTNGLRPSGIEHKLGIHASPTCTMLFEGAHAELIGQPNQGLAHMFTMMNAARLNVGMEGVGIAERAYQQALLFSQERHQGRSPWSSERTAPIWFQPDVRRTLMMMKARIGAARAICLDTAIAADAARGAPDVSVRVRALRREELLTPIAKAWSTDVGVRVASDGVQVHGGMGFVEETGAAQHYRDARIAPIYEGTNGIQAIDLTGRKLGLEGGAAFRELLADVRETLPALDNDLGPVAKRLAPAVDALENSAAWLAERRGSPDALAGATEFLGLAGDVVGGWGLARAALHARTASGPAKWLESKAQLARLFASQVVSAAPARAQAVMAGCEDIEHWQNETQ